MDVSIRNCPACGAVVMGDATSCTDCGQAMPAPPPAPTESAPSIAKSKTQEVTCAKCGARVPKSVLRCRDCGAFMNMEIEAAMLAKQMARGYSASSRPSGSISLGGASGPAANVTEIADDADFDLDADLNLVDLPMEEMENLSRDGRSSGDAAILDDDFELGDGGSDEYAVAGANGAVPGLAGEKPAANAQGSDASAANEKTSESREADASSPSDVPSGTEKTSTEKTDQGKTDKMVGPETTIDHSIQTAGDVLLDAAMAEERDAAQRGRGGHRRLRGSAGSLPPDRVLVYCPNGHRIQVHSKHRGRTGRCPNCKSLYFVPVADTEQTLGQAGGTTESAPQSDADAAAAPQATGYTQWITGVYLHRMNPAKLKLKAGSLIGEHEIADLGLCSEHLLLAVLFAGGGAFRNMQEPKKTAANRQKMLEHLAAKMPVADLPLPRHYPLTAESLQQLKIVQPTPPGEESLFADVPVFGEGRIAVRLPAADAPGERTYLSFTLSQFRGLASFLSNSFGLSEFGAGALIPLTDDFQEATCHYSEAILRSLPADKLDFYKSDPSLKLIPIGRKCQKCGLVVSEDSRKKEKIGGKSDSSVAKAKCPKCKQKFGNITLYGFPQEAPSMGTS